MKIRTIPKKVISAGLALVLCAALLPPRTAYAEEWPQPLPIDLDVFCRQNCVSSFLHFL